MISPKTPPKVRTPHHSFQTPRTVSGIASVVGFLSPATWGGFELFQRGEMTVAGTFQTGGWAMTSTVSNPAAFSDSCPVRTREPI
jgi:hypothetical protein